MGPRPARVAMRALRRAVLLVGLGDGVALAADGAPVSLRGSLVVEPPRVAVGQVIAADLGVVTPPDHRIVPPEPPELAGFWVLDTQLLPVERQADRWLHRVRYRLRARAPGSVPWPDTEVRVEGPDGPAEPVSIRGRMLEVRSVLSEHPQRTAPFGLRAPPAPAAGGGRLWLGIGVGAGLTLLGLGGVRQLRRRARAPARAPRAPGAAPWARAQTELDACASVDNALAAADGAAAALRRYMAARFGADAVTRTTEELRAARPPWGARSAWPQFLGLLERLDGARFRPPARRTGAPAEILADVRAFVRDTTPPEAGP